MGVYDIVSLAQVLSGFEGWERTLRYLHELVEAMSPGAGGGDRGKQPLSGAGIIDRLRGDIYTGFPTLEVVALHLLKIAETAWLREVSTWVLYGRLPSSFSHGASSPSTDFFITEVDGGVQSLGGEEDAGVMKEYVITKHLVPKCITEQTAQSVLFIGRALSIIRLRGGAVTDDSTSVASPEMTLLPVHLSYLQVLESPLSPQLFSNAISSIRLSLSRHTLQTLLPASRIMETITVLREFFLLGRGEFAINLIDQASERVRNRWRRAGAGGGGVGATNSKAPTGVLIKEGEVSAILTRTWGVLSSLQSDEGHDERLEAAREVLYLSLHKPAPTSALSTPALKHTTVGANFSVLLVGVPVCLNFHLSWPLELFLHPVDLDQYDALFGYLLGVRKTQVRLQELWSGRRRFAAEERKVWATASAAVFFLQTLSGYWQGEVIEGAFGALKVIVDPDHAQQQQQQQEAEDDEGDIWMSEELHHSAAAPPPSQQQTEREKRRERERDPESLTRAHAAYLRTLTRSLFLEDTVFAPLLKKFLATCDALTGSIQAMVHNAVLADAVSEAPPPSYPKGRRARAVAASVAAPPADEHDLRAALERCSEVRALLQKLVARLQRIDEEREGFGGTAALEEDVFAVAERVAEKRQEGAKVDRLLMRLDLASLWADPEK